MTPPENRNGPRVTRTTRVLPQQSASHECAVPLSLLDATTAKFALSSAIWLIERPTVSLTSTDLTNHLRTALSSTLDSLPLETMTFPVHAKRYGRVHVHYGTTTDPGVEFVEATSIANVDSLYTAESAKERPIWIRQGDEEALTQFVPLTEVAPALEPNETDTNGLYGSNLAIQCTVLARGGFVLATKIAHPLADITALTYSMRDWYSPSRAMLTAAPLPVLSPSFDPSRLDASAAGDINADPPTPFLDLPLAGKPMPWAEWDTKAPVNQCTVHFSWKQIEHLWQSAIQENSPTSADLKISKHDALLAEGPVHCDLTLATRPVFQLDDSFIGSPTMTMDIEMTAADLASRRLGAIARRIRETLSTVNHPRRLAAHLHSITWYEKSPQRIWQAFLGSRHILVTTVLGLARVFIVSILDWDLAFAWMAILIGDGPPSVL
ncbi:transferase family protein [Boeremia exigua]|uniref:transferase family protein n=1 Tax=Boeremia exigua TaxID=749465 RepID=UPI001E8CAE47|nr:transferase family protein [Boeremia exigua]KAH6612406.1 transferase family protein [Boeremia exigua]